MLSITYEKHRSKAQRNVNEFEEFKNILQRIIDSIMINWKTTDGNDHLKRSAWIFINTMRTSWKCFADAWKSYTNILIPDLLFISLFMNKLYIQERSIHSWSWMKPIFRESWMLFDLTMTNQKSNCHVVASLCSTHLLSSFRMKINLCNSREKLPPTWHQRIRAMSMRRQKIIPDYENEVYSVLEFKRELSEIKIIYEKMVNVCNNSEMK